MFQGMIVGRLGEDPIPLSDGKCARFTIGYDAGKNNADGVWGPNLIWAEVFVIAPSGAQYCVKQLRRGDLVSVNGQPRVKQYEGTAGPVSFYEMIVGYDGRVTRQASPNRKDCAPPPVVAA